MSWATVMLFRRSRTADLIFQSMQMIRRHWRHYIDLYSIPKSTYRNDIALSIAMNIVDGHTQTQPAIPWSLVSLDAVHPLTQLSTDTYRVDFTTPDGKRKWVMLDNQDFHAMGKRHLGDIVANSL
jgi:hypothetical protein